MKFHVKKWVLISSDNFRNDSVKTQLLHPSEHASEKNSYPHKLCYTGMINRKNCIDRREADVLFDVCPADVKKHQGVYIVCQKIRRRAGLRSNRCQRFDSRILHHRRGELVGFFNSTRRVVYPGTLFFFFLWLLGTKNIRHDLLCRDVTLRYLSWRNSEKIRPVTNFFETGMQIIIPPYEWESPGLKFTLKWFDLRHSNWTRSSHNKLEMLDKEVWEKDTPLCITHNMSYRFN